MGGGGWPLQLARSLAHPPVALTCLPPLQGVRQKNFNRIKKVIQENLFLAKPTFIAHLQVGRPVTKPLGFVVPPPRCPWPRQQEGGGVGDGGHAVSWKGTKMCPS